VVLQIEVKIVDRVLPPLAWHISQIIVDVFSLIVNACMMNQFRNHWLFFDALYKLIIMSL
jgi:hypothetical protein